MHALPAEKQVEAVRKKLVELNPGFDGKLTSTEDKPPLIEYGTVTRLSIATDHVTDISPFRALTGLYSLSCHGSGPGKGQLSDLSPLKGMLLGSLVVAQTKVSDLSALNGMSLSFFSFSSTLVSDISPLTGMPLNFVSFTQTKVADLSPLSGSGMSLVRLSLSETPVSDLSPLEGMMKLTHLTFTPKNITHGIDVIRNMKTIERIGTLEWADLPPEEFWKKYDAGEFGKSTSKPLGTLTPGFDQWMKGVQAMPAEKQVDAVSKKLKELNPEFDGTESHKIEGGVVKELGFQSDQVVDISPVRALTGLQCLDCRWQRPGKRAIVGLVAARRHASGKSVFLSTKVSDLSPLRGMPLWLLMCDRNASHGSFATARDALDQLRYRANKDL